jgi:hypothetical protein
MDLATIDMPADEAQQLFEEYRAAVRERHDEEDEQIMRGYRTLAKGQQVLNLPQTIKAGGVDFRTFRDRWSLGSVDVCLPRLAVARANRTTVWTFGINREGHCTMQTKLDPHVNNRYDVMDFAPGTFEEGTADSIWSRPRIRAVIPNVPPRLRPRSGLGNFHVLFEAEWGLDPEPPVDPALLKHIGGDLYAVVAVWDLTDLERAVLAGRS